MIPVASLLLASVLLAGPEVPVSPPTPNAQPYVQRVEDVAASDDVALVVWREDSLLRGARVDRDGTTLDAVPLLIAYAPVDGAEVARGATNWLVVSRGLDSLTATIVGDDGAVGARVQLPVGNAVADVAFNGSEYLVAWWDVDASRVSARRISASGQLLGSAVLVDDQRIFRAVFPEAGGGFVLIVQRENVEAIHLDAAAREVSRTTLWPSIEGQAPMFALDESGHVVMGWTANGSAYVQREGAGPVAIDALWVEDFVTTGGTTYVIARRDGDLVLATLDGTTVRGLDGPAEKARAASFGDRVLVVHSYTDIVDTTLDASLQTITPLQLVYAEAQLQTSPAIARAGDATLIAWIEGAPGRVLVKLNDGPAVDFGEGFSVQIATDGHGFLVTWTTVLLQHFRAVAHDGTPGAEGTTGFFSAGGCVTWTGDTYLIGYVNLPPHPRLDNHTARAQRVSREGVAVGDGLLISAMAAANSVSCASTATTTLFAFDEQRGAIRGVTLTRGGTLSSFMINGGAAPNVAAQGDSFLVTWVRQQQTGYWASVSEGGTVGLERTTPANAMRVTARPGGYLLMYGTDPLRVRTVDRDGHFTGPELRIASKAGAPVFDGNTLLYMRDTDILPQPRWRVFGRELDFSGRRRVMRH